MNALRDLLKLFVDDGSLAIALLLWLAVMAAVVHGASLGAGLEAGLFFLGCAGILIENVMRRARRGKAPT